MKKQEDLLKIRSGWYETKGTGDMINTHKHFIGEAPCLDDPSYELYSHYWRLRRRTKEVRLYTDQFNELVALVNNTKGVVGVGFAKLGDYVGLVKHDETMLLKVIRGNMKCKEAFLFDDYNDRLESGVMTESERIDARRHGLW